jgi:hypothetical protein
VPRAGVAADGPRAVGAVLPSATTPEGSCSSGFSRARREGPRRRAQGPDRAEKFADSTVTDDRPGQELLDLLDRLMAKLSEQNLAVATCYARIDGLTWAQAALRSDAPAAAGERVRRRLKRLRGEDLRRRGRPSAT